MDNDALDDSAAYIVLIEALLAHAECGQLIDSIERADPTPAPINTVDGVQRNPDVRNNDRTMIEDAEFAAKLFERAKARIPPQVFGRNVVGVNELFRCYRYRPGMKFSPHTDGAYERSPTERSFYSFLIYLNEVEAGGQTNFLVEPELSIEPKAGLGVIFQHPISHEGAVVTKGVKYVLRTDVMYGVPDEVGSMST